MAFGIDLIQDWQMLSMLLAFLSVLIAIIVYMVAKVFQHTKLEQTAKSEIIFAASTVVLVLFVVITLPLVENILVNFICQFYQPVVDSSLPQPLNLCSGNNLTLADLMLMFLANTKACISNFLAVLYTVDIFVEAMQSVSMEVFMSELATGFFYNFFVERITTITNIFSFYLTMYYLIYHILIFLKYLGLLFFTLGVVLRAFPLTRGAGAFIMALSIGLYFIFPFSYVAMTLVFSSYGSQSCEVHAIHDLPESTCGSTSAGKLFEYKLTFESSLSWLTDLIQKLETYSKLGTINLCFMPIIALTITLSFVLSTSTLFGATIPEVGRGLVKLI